MKRFIASVLVSVICFCPALASAGWNAGSWAGVRRVTGPLTIAGDLDVGGNITLAEDGYITPDDAGTFDLYIGDKSSIDQYGTLWIKGANGGSGSGVRVYPRSDAGGTISAWGQFTYDDLDNIVSLGTKPGQQDLALDTAGNMGLGAKAWGTNADTVFAMLTGTAPITQPADTGQVVVKDGPRGAGTASWHWYGEENGDPVIIGGGELIAQTVTVGTGTKHDGWVVREEQEIQTTDATQTTLDSITLLDENTYQVEAWVVAVQADGTDRASYHIACTVYRTAAGSATLQGTVTSLHTQESNASTDATCTVSGSDVRISWTGIAAETWEAGTTMMAMNMSN